MLARGWRVAGGCEAVGGRTSTFGRHPGRSCSGSTRKTLALGTRGRVERGRWVAIALAGPGQKLDSPDIGLTVLRSLQDITLHTRVSVVILRSGKGLKMEAAAGDLAPWLRKSGSR